MFIFNLAPTFNSREVSNQKPNRDSAVSRLKFVAAPRGHRVRADMTPEELDPAYDVHAEITRLHGRGQPIRTMPGGGNCALSLDFRSARRIGELATA